MNILLKTKHQLPEPITAQNYAPPGDNLLLLFRALASAPTGVRSVFCSAVSTGISKFCSLFSLFTCPPDSLSLAHVSTSNNDPPNHSYNPHCKWYLAQCQKGVRISEYIGSSRVSNRQAFEMSEKWEKVRKKIVKNSFETTTFFCTTVYSLIHHPVISIKTIQWVQHWVKRSQHQLHTSHQT